MERNEAVVRRTRFDAPDRHTAIGGVSARTKRMAGLALAGALELAGCGINDAGHKTNSTRSVASAVWKDVPSSPPWGQKRNAQSPFVIWKDDINGTALFARSQAEEGDVTVPDIYCSTTTDGSKTWTAEKKIDDSVLSAGGKINTGAYEDSAVLRKELDSTYTLYFHSSWGGGDNIYKSKKFDIDTCKAATDKEKLSSAPGYINDGVLNANHITYSSNGFLYASSSSSSGRGIYRVDPDTGKYTVVSGTKLLEFRSATVWQEGGKWYMGSSRNFGCGSLGGYDLCLHSLSLDGLTIIGSGVNFNSIPDSPAKPNTVNDDITPHVDSKGTLRLSNGPDYFGRIGQYDAIIIPPPTDAGADAVADTSPEPSTEAGGADASDADATKDSTGPDTTTGDATKDSTEPDTTTGDGAGDADPKDADAGDAKDATKDSTEPDTTTGDGAGDADPKDADPTCPVQVTSGNCEVPNCSGVDIPINIANKPCIFTFQTNPLGKPTTVDCTGSGTVSVNRSTHSLTDDKNRGVSCKITDLDKLNSLNAILVGIEMFVEGTKYGWLHNGGEITELYVETGKVRVTLNTPDKGTITVTLNAGESLKVKHSPDDKVTPLSPEKDGGLSDAPVADAVDSAEQPPRQEQPSCGPCNTVGSIKSDVEEQALGVVALAGLTVALAMRRKKEKHQDKD